MEINSGAELWKKAKEIIPTGNQLLSKRSERFLPKNWPSYYKEAKGCEVWDLDNNHYYDFAQMGVGSCILGYANPVINEAVINAISKGSMSSLNSYEEYDLAEKLISITPCGEMVRFARTGGEACAVGVRIARAASGKGRVAFCGYHGWHDWYISANLGDNSSLDNQLIPGLKPNGVPRELKNTSVPFQYNDIDSLEKIIGQYNDIGVIYMEPTRNMGPENDFLLKVRNIATKVGAVLIFDEVTSGFRENLGGIHVKYNVIPDMVIYGKALGNGYPISAIVGKKSVMESAETSFISSTFWTERIGFVAGLSTINFFEKNNVAEHLIKMGKLINEGWKAIANKHDISIHISGIEPLTHLGFKYENAMAIQTYCTQEMLKRGYLLGASVYTTYSYNDDIIDGFIKNYDDVLTKLKPLIVNNEVENRLEGPIIETGFKRLN